MSRIVIASASEASRNQLARLLASSGYAVFRLCGSEGELRRALAECEDGIVLVSGIQPDDIAADFEGRFQFLLIGRPETLNACESPQVFKLAYPCPGSAVIGAVEMLSQLHRMRLPRRTGESRELVDRAKAMLMKQKNLTEPEAHRTMQQYAMNHGMKMAEFARRILEQSEEGCDALQSEN